MTRAWIRAEVDGSHPRNDPIVEVCLVLTDDQMEELTSIALTVNPRLDGRWGPKWTPSTSVSSAIKREVSFGVSTKTADSTLVQTMQRISPDNDVPVSVPPSIVPFLRAQLPDFCRMLDLDANFDPDSLRLGFELADRGGLIPALPNPSRAMARLLNEVGEVRVLIAAIRLLVDEDEGDEL